MFNEGKVILMCVHMILAWFLFRNEYGLSACQLANINIYLELRERI